AIRRVVFEAPSGTAASVELPRPLGIFSRRLLDRALVREAEAAGAMLVREGIVSIERVDRGFSLSLTGGAAVPFDPIVRADAARRPRRAGAGPFAHSLSLRRVARSEPRLRSRLVAGRRCLGVRRSAHARGDRAGDPLGRSSRRRARARGPRELLRGLAPRLSP